MELQLGRNGRLNHVSQVVHVHTIEAGGATTLLDTGVSVLVLLIDDHRDNEWVGGKCGTVPRASVILRLLIVLVERYSHSFLAFLRGRKLLVPPIKAMLGHLLTCIDEVL